MSVVITGHFFVAYQYVLLIPLGIFISALIGFSRLYSRSRFPHQVVGSYLSGFVGLVLSKHCCDKMAFHK